MNPMLNNFPGNQNPLGWISALKSMNPDAVYQQMINTNPQFKKFVEDNQGKA